MRRLFSRIDWSFAMICALSGGSALTVLMRSGWPRFFEILTGDAWLLLEIAPKMIAGVLIGSFIRLLAPRDAIRRWIGEGSGVTGLAIASLAGMTFPAGPFTIFPLAAAFLVAGADRGAAIAFLSSWLLLGINRGVIWEMPFLGLDFVLMRSLVALPMPVLAGWLARQAPLKLVMMK